MGRSVRMGIDIGGTHTKAVAIDNATHEIIGKSSVKTTHDDPRGVAAGVVKSFENCLNENGITRMMWYLWPTPPPRQPMP